MTPTTEELEIILDKELGVDYFLERRELGVINIGDQALEIDGAKETMKNKMAIILGKKQNMFVFFRKP